VRHTAWWIVGAGALLAGCGAPTVGEYAEQLELAYCQWETECHRFSSVTECQGARGLDRAPEFVYLIEAVAAGSAEYDAEAALGCLAAIREQGCGEAYPERPADCEAVFRGRIGRNGPCMSSLECAGDAVCGFDPGCADECCPGACRVLPEPQGKGETCGGTALCKEGLYCAVDPTTFAPTVCESRVKAGGGCLFGDECVESAFCDGETCRKYADREVGESCDAREDRCVAPAECHSIRPGDETEVLRCVVPAGLGEPCDPDDYAGCARFDTFCEATSRLCTLLPVPGAACSPEGCAGYAFCVNDAGDEAAIGTCEPLAGPGDACGDIGAMYVQCLGDLWCEDSVCALQEQAASECPVPGAG